MKKKPQRDTLEIWLDKHNHKFEFLRTIFGFIAAIGGALATCKVLGVFK